MAVAIGANLKDIEMVQVHPTGLVHPDTPNDKILFLAAEALRGAGGIILDRDGNRFTNELGRRDEVTAAMWKRDKGPYRLVLNSTSSKNIEWHCKHYAGRGLMKFYKNGEEFAKDTGIPIANLRSTFEAYDKCCAQKSDSFAKKFFEGAPWKANDSFNVAIITPVLHYCMGGVNVDTNSQVLSPSGPIEGLFASGEVVGGIHGLQRLGGSSLLDCVVFGRVAGRSCSKYLLSEHLNNEGTTVNRSQSQPTQTQTKAEPSQSASSGGKKSYSLAEVAQHKTEKDCWVVVNDEVLNVTEFLPDHPGGKKAILLYAGKDASEEFNMLHDKNVVVKYAPDAIIGTLKK